MQDGVAPELPAARVVAPPPTGIDHPGAGLVLVFVALASLSQLLGVFAQLVILDRGARDHEIMVMLVTMLLVTGSQLAAGVAIAWQLSSRRQWFAGFVCASIAAVLITPVWWPDDLGARQLGVLALELLATPLLVVVGPRLFRLRSGPGLAGLLVVGGTSLLLTQAVRTFEQARGLVHSESIGSWLGVMLHVAIAIASGVLALRAGLRLSYGEPARRAVGAYVIVAIASIVILDAISIVYWVIDGHLENAWRYVLPSMLTGAVIGIARPLIVWLYAQRELATSAPGTSALPWLALWFVPPLIGRLLLYEQLAQLGDIARVGLMLGAATAIAIVVAVKTGRLWWLPAALAGALFVLGVYATQMLDDRFGSVRNQIVAPLAMLFAALATAAWFARGVRSA